jgi:cold-inducible RNA-binding protein
VDNRKGLTLLSRIDGDAPRAQTNWRWRFGWFESRLIVNFRSRSFRASEPGPSTATVYRRQSDSQLLLPLRKKVHIYMSMKLYVGNLAFQTNSQQLQELFAQSGTVESASVIEDRETGRSRGFAFVEMSTKEEGDAAIATFNGKEVNGRALKVNEAKPRENSGGRGFGGGGGGGYRGNGGGGGGGNRGNFGGGGGGRNDREPRW